MNFCVWIRLSDRTGLLDPEVEVRPVEGQIDDLVGEVNKEIAKKNKILITTLTKRMAEDLTDYMRELGIRVKYLHSDIDTFRADRNYSGYASRCI